MRRIFSVLAAKAIAFALVTNASAQELSTTVTLCHSDVEQGAGNNLAAAVTAAEVLRTPVHFNCPQGTVITMTAALTSRGGVVIDGDNKVTLDAGGRDPTLKKPIFTVRGGDGEFVLRNITARRSQIDGGNSQFSSIGAPGSLIDSDQTVQLVNARIEDSVQPVKTTRSLFVVDSTIRGNVGWVLNAAGDSFVTNSTFAANRGSSALYVDGRTEILNSKFIGNQEAVTITGGVIKNTVFQANIEFTLSVWKATDLSVTGCVFDANTGSAVVTPSADQGGTILFRKNVFTNNLGQLFYLLPRQASAGAPLTSVVFSRNKFVGNKGVVAGTLTLNPDAAVKVLVTGNTFVNNSSDSTGGALNWTGSDIVISHNLLKGNRAKKGGALHGNLKLPGGTWVIANSVIVENSSADDSGAVDVTEAQVVNVTIAKNSGYGLVFQTPTSQALLANSILSNNSAGNCKGVPTGTIKNGNLQFGANDCDGAEVVDPQLDELFVPALGSTALVAGDPNICRKPPVNSVDVLYQRRDDSSRCTSGAYERAPIQAATRKVSTNKSCPGGITVSPSVPCPGAIKTCPSGGAVPSDGVCPEPPQTCPDGSIVPAGLNCRNKTCPGGMTVPVNAQCPQTCPAGCSGTYPNCQCPCPAPCSGTRPNCQCPCQNNCSCRRGSGCSTPPGSARNYCNCSLPGQTLVPDRYCFRCVN